VISKNCSCEIYKTRKNLIQVVDGPWEKTFEEFRNSAVNRAAIARGGVGGPGTGRSTSTILSNVPIDVFRGVASPRGGSPTSASSKALATILRTV
jgi:hypothetical protein